MDADGNFCEGDGHDVDEEAGVEALEVSDVRFIESGWWR